MMRMGMLPEKAGQVIRKRGRQTERRIPATHCCVTQKHTLANVLVSNFSDMIFVSSSNCQLVLKQNSLISLKNLRLRLRHRFLSCFF